MIKMFFPFIEWLKDYSFEKLKIDSLSGLTVALVLIPQSMAYAQLAGMPSYYGLYASFLPPIIASLFGSSRQLATGPVAVVSLMTAASLEPLATAGSEGYIAYAILLALMVGVFQFSLGVLRLGVVVNFLSHPVVNGFTNAAAIIIASSQLSKMFGIYVDKAAHHYETIFRVCMAAGHYTHWPTLIMGVLAFGIMYGLKRFNPKIPNVLVAVAVTTIISWAIGFQHDNLVDLNAIKAPQVHEMVVGFNRSVVGINTATEERTRFMKTLDDAKTHHDNIAGLDAQHAINVVNFKIDQLKEEAHTYRKDLRDMMFYADDTGSQQVFRLKNDPALKDPKDTRIWRIKIGNRALDTQNLLMTGGGAVVGSIPKGLPAFTMPEVNFKVMLQLFPYAAIISLLGFMEAISIAKAMAAKTGQRLDPNQELIGQGLANMMGAMSKSYPTSGSFSRSAVNLQAGAMTGLSSAFTSLAVVIVLLFFTPLLYHLPQAVLAAVIMMAVIGLVNISGFVHAWKVQWYDGAISIIAFVSTLIFAPHLDRGIMIGVLLSLMVFLYKSMRPTVTSLSRHEDDGMRDAVVHGLQQCEYIDMVRFEGPLFFANATYLEDKINERMMNRKNLKHIIIVSNAINDIDASGEEVLSLLIENVRSAGVEISFSGVNESVMKVFERTHLMAMIRPENIYPTMEQAICAVHAHAHQNGEETLCPLTTVCHIA
ncbi:MAG: SulP family inorganic anion transporter [Desulfobacteraceae bacterium]|nr:SulP family inorganic anion transporter [Desulfobacteraceae bacterium]MBC2755034.1 SulP family inorganic anion transporter [Desulfobacteraceae bacterium]